MDMLILCLVKRKLKSKKIKSKSKKFRFKFYMGYHYLQDCRISNYGQVDYKTELVPYKDDPKDLTLSITINYKQKVEPEKIKINMVIPEKLESGEFGVKFE